MRGTPEQFARLPLWARSEIELLNRRLVEQIERAERAEAAAGWESANYGRLRPLRPDDDVLFGGHDDDFQSQIIVSERKPNVLSVSTAGKALLVRPQGSNVIEIRTEPL